MATKTGWFDWARRVLCAAIVIALAVAPAYAGDKYVGDAECGLFASLARELVRGRDSGVKREAAIKMVTENSANLSSEQRSGFLGLVNSIYDNPAQPAEVVSRNVFNGCMARRRYNTATGSATDHQ